MEPVNVSLRKIHGGTVSAFSSQLDEEHAASTVLADEGYWSTQKSNSIVPEFVIIDYGEALPVDCVEISASPSGRAAFPQDFRVEASTDGRVWRVVQTERKYELEDNLVYRLDVPLSLVRLSACISSDPKVGGEILFRNRIDQDGDRRSPGGQRFKSFLVRFRARASARWRGRCLLESEIRTARRGSTSR